MRQFKEKKVFCLLMGLLIFATSFQFRYVRVDAKTENLTLHYASETDTGVISEFSNYDHGKAMYGIIDGETAYCMNYSKSADGGQSMDSITNPATNLSIAREKQLFYCMYYGHTRKSTSAPSEKNRNEFLATQAMVWIITSGLYGDSSADSAAKKICDSAPNTTGSYSYYETLKKKMSDALNQEIPSFAKESSNLASTIELEWNETNDRFEKTITDSNNVLADFDISMTGISKSISGNRITFYTTSVISTARTATFDCKNDSVKLKGSSLYWTTGKSDYQEFVSTAPTVDPVTAYLKIKTEDIGYGDLFKKDVDSGALLAGAEYGIYSDSACTALVEKMKTNSKGYVKSGALPAGTYYVKETKAPNKYTISTKIHKVVITAGKTTTIQATNKEQRGAIRIYKEGEVLTGWDGTKFLYEIRRLAGLKFKVTAGADIFKVDGTKRYNKGDEIASDLITNASGMAILSDLEFGTYIVTETATIDGYTINTTPQSVTISYKDQNVAVQYEVATVFNQRQKAEVSVLKLDSSNKNPLLGGRYSLYADNDIKNVDGTVIVEKGTLLETVKTVRDGKAVFSLDLPIENNYYVSETQAPFGYVKNASDVYRFTFSYLTSTTAKAAFTHTFENNRTTAKLHLYKQDIETGLPVPQGDASLEGAVYGLYARNAIPHPDGITGAVYQANELVARLTTDKNGEAEIKNLFLGQYYVKEITPPEGYNIDPAEHDVIFSYANDTEVEIGRSTTSKEQVNKQPFQLIKVSDNGMDTEAPVLEGAGFTAYLQSDLPLKENGDYDFSKGTPVVIGKNGETVLYTDKKGYLQTIPIPYGTYVVVESVTPHNREPVKPFIVKVTEHKPNEPQAWRVFLDKEFKAKLRIVKKDAKTNRSVLVPNAEFKIYNTDKKEYVTQYTRYPSVTKHTSFFTDSDGDLILPEYLTIGNYRIEETAAPNGYVLNDNHIEFAVDSNTAYEIHGDTKDIIITMDYMDEPVVGELLIEKKGEILKDYKKSGKWLWKSKEKKFDYAEISLAGAEFELYAAEDIYTNDYQSNEKGERYLYYSEGELVDTLITDADGRAGISDLPLGKYKVVETKAPEGYVLDDQEHNIEFVYVDDETPVISEILTLSNERQKAKLSVEKLDAQEHTPIAGAEFGLYAKSAVKNADDTVVADADTLIETAVSDEKGMVIFKKELPFGSYYAKELKAPSGYVSTSGAVEFDFSYQGQDVKVVELAHQFENTPTTVKISKTDITGEQELEGATLTLLNDKGKVIEKWISGKKPHYIERIGVGKYILREEFAPLGYTIANDVSFEVSDTGEVQKVSMKDETTKGRLRIFKMDKDTRKPIAGVEFEFRRGKKVLEVLKTDKKGYAVSKEFAIGSYQKGQFKKAITYTLVEKKAAEGYVLDKTPQKIVFQWKDGKTPVIEITKKLTNESITETPKTGDSRKLMLWRLICSLSGTALGILIAGRMVRKRNGQ